LISDLTAGIDSLYETFAVHLLPADTDACPCCHSDLEEAALHASPIRELAVDVITNYTGDAMMTCENYISCRDSKCLPAAFEANVVADGAARTCQLTESIQSNTLALIGTDSMTSSTGTARRCCRWPGPRPSDGICVTLRTAHRCCCRRRSFRLPRLSRVARWLRVQPRAPRSCLHRPPCAGAGVRLARGSRPAARNRAGGASRDGSIRSCRSSRSPRPPPAVSRRCAGP
jgi:hypothetical protein